MNMYQFKYIIILGVLFIAIGCSEKVNSPIENDNTAPDPVKNVKVENMHGAAQLTYTVPDNSDLLAVRAEYHIEAGDQEVTSSFYNNSLMVEGFGKAGDYKVTLYTIDRSGNESTPVKVDVHPLTPPIVYVYESLEVKKDFGGINITFQNQYESNIVITTMAKDSLGEWTDSDKYYTSRNGGSYSVRGFDPVKTEFRIFVRDRWQNHTDTLNTEVVPIYEEKLDKSKFEEVDLPTDEPNKYSSWTMDKMWDDNIDSGFHTAEGSGFPQHFTFDMGAKVKLSRMRTWQRQGDWIYTHGNPRIWEMWGSNDPAPDGSWDGWTKLMRCESIKPSGLPQGQYSNEDKEYAAAGENFTYPSDAPAVRYIRFKVIASWSAPANSPNGFFHLMEFTLWGQVQETYR